MKNSNVLTLDCYKFFKTVKKGVCEIDIVFKLKFNKNIGIYNQALFLEIVRRGSLFGLLTLLRYPSFRKNIASGDNAALQWAAYHGHLDIVNKLLEYTDVQANITAGNNCAVRWAAEHGHILVVEKLLEYPAVQNNIAADDNYALRWAAYAGHMQLVKMLLEYPTVCKNITAFSHFAIVKALDKNNIAIARKLLEVYAAWELELPDFKEAPLLNKLIMDVNNEFDCVKAKVSNWLLRQYNVPTGVSQIIFQYNNHLAVARCHANKYQLYAKSAFKKFSKPQQIVN